MIVLPQLRTEDAHKSLNMHSHNDLSWKEILAVRLFCGDNMRVDADTTLVLGDFNREQQNLPHKCLMLCWHGMHVNSKTTVEDQKWIAKLIEDSV